MNANILHEVLPRKARLVIYIIVALALLALTAYKTADGDLFEAGLTLLGALAPALAAGNITPEPEYQGRHEAP